VLSYAWTGCANTPGYGFIGTGPTDAGFGDLVGYTFDNSYGGYNANYAFSNQGNSTTVFYGNMIIAVD
jgi:hypothetical protein